MPIKYELGGIKATIDSPTSIAVTPVKRVRLTGFLFETAKTFLLPSAMHGLRELVRFYQDEPSVLVSGHADTVGAATYNRDLSVERAQSIAAFLKDDDSVWLAFYSPGKVSSLWGVREDQYMLSMVGFPCAITGANDSATRKAYRGYQESKGLSPSEQGDRPTREALIKDYMDQDGTTLPPSATLQSHGCGEWYPAVASGDNRDEQANRRVEIFLFDGDIEPPPQAPCPQPGCPEYPMWVKKSTDTVDFGDEAATLTVTVVDKRGKPIADAEVTLSGVVEDTGKTDKDGTRLIADLPPGCYALTARQGPYASEPKDIDVPSGESQQTAELPDVGFIVYKEEDGPKGATDKLVAGLNTPLSLWWSIRGVTKKGAEMASLALQKATAVDVRHGQLDGDLIGHLPLTLATRHVQGGVAEYEVRVAGEPPRKITVTCSEATYSKSGLCSIHEADEIRDARELGLVRVCYSEV